MKYLLNEDEYQEYQALKNEDVDISVGSIIDVDEIVMIFLDKCETRSYKSAEHMGATVLGFEIKLRDVPEKISNWLIKTSRIRSL